MKKQLIILFATLLLPLASYANCGVVPQAPAALAKVQLTAAAFEALSPEMDSYFDAIATFKTCVENAIAELVPADADPDSFQTPAYLAGHQTLMGYYQQAEQQQATAIERYNHLVDNILPEPEG